MRQQHDSAILILLSLGTAVLILTAVFFVGSFFSDRPVVRETETRSDDDGRVARALDGVLVQPAKATPRSIAVVIDNMRDAWPLAGIAEAPLVWEAPVEGGLTRLLAVYPLGAIPEKVGPVRSLRPYFLDWALEVDAALLHVGGSPAALEKAATGIVATVNQFYQSSFFWRDRARSAPHNVYTSGAQIAKMFEDPVAVPIDRKDLTEGAFSSWVYTDAAPPGVRASSLRIAFASQWDAARWVWNPEDAVYVRHRNGDPFLDLDGNRMTAKNIVVLTMPVTILDDIGRRAITTIGAGDALFFRDGVEVEGTWERKGLHDRTKFFARDGAEFPLARGTTWVEVIPRGTRVEVEE